MHAGLSSLTHNTLPHWQSSSSDQQGSSLAQQVGQVMCLPHQSPAFLLGAGSSHDPDSALLLDTNIQVYALSPLVAIRPHLELGAAFPD